MGFGRDGRNYYLWRTVGNEGAVLDCYASKKRDKKTAQQLLKKLVFDYGRPKEIITDKLSSYKMALKELDIVHLHNTDQYANNQVENSYLHFRQRGRGMNKFGSHGTLQKFTPSVSRILE